MKNLFLALFLILLMPLQVSAAQWWDVTMSHNGDIYYVDLESITIDYDKTYIYGKRDYDLIDNGKVTYWYKVLYKNIKKIKTEDRYIQGYKVIYSLVQRIENCNDKASTLLQLIDYGAKDQILDSNNVSNGYFKAIVPDSVGFELHKFACSNAIKIKSGMSATDIYTQLKAEENRESDKFWANEIKKDLNEVKYALSKNNLIEANTYLTLISVKWEFMTNKEHPILIDTCRTYVQVLKLDYEKTNNKANLDKIDYYDNKANELEQLLQRANQ